MNDLKLVLRFHVLLLISLLVLSGGLVHAKSIDPQCRDYLLPWQIAVVRQNPTLKGLMNYDAYRAMDNKRKKSITIALVGDAISEEIFAPLNAPMAIPFGFNFITDSTELSYLSGHEQGIASWIHMMAGFNLCQKFSINIISLQISAFTNHAGTKEEYISLVAEAIDYAIKADVDIINLSLGVGENSNMDYTSVDNLQEKITAAHNKGIYIFASASNDRRRNHEVERQIPANLDNVISIANHDRNYIIQSGYGQNIDISFLGTHLDGLTLDERVLPKAKGSSNATGLISGIWGVLMSHYPEMTKEEGIELLYESLDTTLELSSIRSSGSLNPIRLMKNGQRKFASP